MEEWSKRNGISFYEERRLWIMLIGEISIFKLLTFFTLIFFLHFHLRKKVPKLYKEILCVLAQIPQLLAFNCFCSPSVLVLLHTYVFLFYIFPVTLKYSGVYSKKQGQSSVTTLYPSQPGSHWYHCCHSIRRLQPDFSICLRSVSFSFLSSIPLQKSSFQSLIGFSSFLVSHVLTCHREYILQHTSSILHAGKL